MSVNCLLSEVYSTLADEFNAQLKPIITQCTCAFKFASLSQRNVRYAKSICILKNDEEIPISRAKIADVKNKFQDYLRWVR